MTVIAIGVLSSAPSPTPKAIGNKPSAVVSVVLMIAGVIILIVSGTMGSNKGKQIYEELNSTWNGTGLSCIGLFRSHQSMSNR